MEIIKNYGDDLNNIIAIIERAKSRAIRAVNAEMIDMYWQIGKYISEKTNNGGWGKSVVQDFSEYLKKEYPSARGFSAQNIWRMKQFYETYRNNEKLSPLVREIAWSNNLLIMSGCKTDEAKEFYIRLCIANGYSKRELERQIDSMIFERTVLSTVKNKDLIEQHPAVGALRDYYVLEFLDIPEDYKEKDLRKSIITNLKQFILEFGTDFSFVGEEYRVQVGNTDFFIDLLFYNRALSCLVAVELKVGRFKPEHLGQLNFYLEALNRDVRKPGENPSVGLILCASKDDTVVEYALSSSLSPTMVADYTLRLPDKKLLEEKLREISILADSSLETEE
ncbi:MAG: DUF1016 family protein [Clostridia bacterium]|nr:DUF1016 family protein [Clostridia bacterium]